MMQFLKKSIISFAVGILFLAGTGALAAPNDLRQQVGEQFAAGGRGATFEQELDPRLVIANVISTVLEIVGILFLSLIVLAGFWYITAEGDEGKIDKAKKLMSGAIVGLIIVLSSYGITLFFISRVTEALLPAAQLQ